MKIYYASQSFYPHIGGVSTYLLNLCKEMVALGNEVVEVHLRPAGEEHYEEVSGVEVHRVPKEPINKDIMAGYSAFKETVYKGSHYQQNLKAKSIDEVEGFSEFNKVNEYFGEEIRTLLEEEPADVVHIHDFQLLFAYRYVPRGTPLILTWHIPFIKEMAGVLQTFLIKHLNEYDKVVFSSKDYIKAAVEAGLAAEKAELIHPIANTNLFKVMEVDAEAVRKRYKLPVKGKLILSVQRVDPKSGHEQLIRALPLVLKAVPDATLVFVGGDSLSNKISAARAQLREHVERLIDELGVRERVIFTGTVDYEKLPEVYNAVDVVALCSKNEGFGLAVTEGMACGKPVVGTRVGGIPLQIDHGMNGFLAEAGDYEQTARQLVKLLQDEKLRERMGAAAAAIAHERFGISRGIEKHASMYTKLIGQKDEFRRIEYLKPKDVKGLITDLDRTITDRAGNATFDERDFDKQLLVELKGLDVELFLATGRVVAYARALSNHFKAWKAVVCENGAVVYFPEGKKTLTINTTYMKKAKKAVREMGLSGTVTGKVIASIRKEDEELVRQRLGKLCEHLTFSTNVDEVMILPEGVTKGLGVRLAMQHLGIDLEKTVCIGDGENDIDLFLNPGFKVAVANAHPNLKKLADQVTKLPSTAGVREVIRKLKE